MNYRRRIYYSAAQRAEIWDRWQRGESMSSIGRAFDRQSSSVFSVISPTGGIRPPDRKRGRQALSLSEREEISRGLSIKQSLRVSEPHSQLAWCEFRFIERKVHDLVPNFVRDTVPYAAWLGRLILQGIHTASLTQIIPAVEGGSGNAQLVQCPPG